ncbi:inovirus-type Gp2 protein [Burkholderia sp. AU30198]|uniref:inovirus-type Gp2 protein n=1 Tax=Burkholderia sp. AU30198 TaxID=2879627 RepID=UPI001CF3C2A5|nr:inovirus-type Gp2 protein [Burkholderia sp. AU30198]MCA8296890.1 inovirus-type Gp2 protein [Burkholderia sp. AU30198]
MSRQASHGNRFGFDSNVFEKNQSYPGFVRYWEIDEYADLMRDLVRFLDTVLETTQVPFEIRGRAGYQRAVRNPIGHSGYRSLSGFMSQCGQWMGLYWPEYAYSADLQLFFDCFMQHRFSQVFSNGVLSSNVDKAVAADLYNNFIGCLRTEAVRRGVRKSLFNWRGNLVSQEGSIRRYLNTLYGRHRRLIPLRLDLSYSMDAFDDNDARVRTSWARVANGDWTQVVSNVPIGDGKTETRARIDPVVAMGDRDRFFRNRGSDRALFDPVVGYICKMEQGGEHWAFHFHCIFFFDAELVRRNQLSELKDKIANRWSGVTRGQGLMFDCHERKDQAELRAQGRWAIDAIDCSNPVQVARLSDYVADYFAKDDGQMVRVKPTAKAWTLTMGRK